MPAGGSTFALGSTSVTCTATDNANVQASCTFDVAVSQNAAPTIVCNSDLTVATSGGAALGSATYTVTGADVSGQTPALTCVPPSPARLPLGASQVFDY